MAVFFAHRTYQRIKIIGMFVAIFGVLVGALAWLLPQNSSTYLQSFSIWLVAIPLLLVTWFSLEWAGTKLLSLPFWQRMPSFVRITLLVVFIALIFGAIFAALAQHWGQTRFNLMVNKWEPVGPVGSGLTFQHFVWMLDLIPLFVTPLFLAPQ